MNNITYSDISRIPRGHLAGDINIINEAIDVLCARLAADYDRRVMGLIEKRLGGLPVDLTTLVGRLTRVITRGTGYETLLLDGRPFARVYEAELTQGGLMMTVGQVIEELEG